MTFANTLRPRYHFMDMPCLLLKSMHFHTKMRIFPLLNKNSYQCLPIGEEQKRKEVFGCGASVRQCIEKL